MGLRLPPHLFAQLPSTEYYKMHNVRSKPRGFVGEWPTFGCIYTGRLEKHPITRNPHVRLDGLHCEEPHSTFPLWRFKVIATVWLN